jgi:excisionase family DNA binding protein
MNDHQPRTTLDMDGPLLDKAGAMAYLGVSLRTLNRLIASKEIDVVRPAPGGRTVRFDPRALRDYTYRHTDRAAANQRRGAK